ncbi:respiratory nitrate reductase chaperone NarJ [Pseudaminobacter salicylatoxidans]|uniref:Respiratory nitrate reductase chaperone NarJ n=1 Tax=Pseudaminobacter salicylatoxidans TaxID=93369 RepID=A0A316C2D0_PSESE|nr:nitrate reductase molybdenum cofactor assembly chaperone [Pseudaminobacter salicylatoxidans]PWJ83781.1 respiratory nitrate reductase chaperone NarJ [Pseudaminobacter salicylatoxidans]
MNLLFKAFSALLSYPTAEMREALPEIAEVVRGSELVAPREREALLDLIAEIGRDDQLAAEERYVDLFDRGRALSLHLFEHLHGESRDRGSAMVELKQLYAGAGYGLTANELPDYLPVVLEYLSLRDLGEAREMLADCAHILKSIARSLIGRESRYAAVPQALLVIAGQKAVDASAIPPVREHHQTLDRDWFEQPAFGEAADAGRTAR